jgi:hypothetical protein
VQPSFSIYYPTVDSGKAALRVQASACVDDQECVRYHLQATFLFKGLDQVALNFTSLWPALSVGHYVHCSDLYYCLESK